MTGTELLALFNTPKPNPTAYEKLPAFLTQDTGEVESFVHLVLQHLPKGGTYFDAALSHISESALVRLVEEWIAPLKPSSALTDTLESLIAYASLQQPSCLHPFLETLFLLRPNEDTYYENWLWRGGAVSEYLRDNLQDEEDESAREKAFSCLLETRTPEALNLAIEAYPSLSLSASLDLHLAEVGFTKDGRQLYSDHCSHIIFPKDYFAPPAQSWSLKGLHSSWNLPSQSGESFRFGGTGDTVCGLCNTPLCHLISVPHERVFRSSPFTGNLNLQVCLSCLGWEEPVLHYHYTEAGTIEPLNKGQAQPEFPALPLKQISVTLVDTPPRWKWQDWALSNSRENLNRINGHPSWIQGADYPSCKSCNEPMHFIMQLDSDLPTQDGAEWLWGSGGICYGFACDTCRNVAFLWQCT